MIYKTYDGPLDFRTMSKEVKRAYVSWANQCSKCNNPKNPDYKYYGGKGIRVEYSSREFVSWWLFNINGREFKKPTTGRVDHDKSYSFDNIEIQEQSENSKERQRRLGPGIATYGKTKPRKTAAFKNGVKIREFSSASEAARFYKKPDSTIARICNGNNGLKKIRTGETFKYV